MTESTDRQREAENGELESLMLRYQQADAEAASLLANRLNEKLYRFFVAQLRDRSRAEDLLQECWLRIHKARQSYRPGEPLLPWIFAIARRAQVDHYRKGQRIAQHELQEEHIEGVAKAEMPPLGSAGIFELLKALPVRQRETVLLLKVAGLSLEEVSRTTGVSVGAVKQRAHRAYTTLRRLLEGER